jgi:hypothetical protein
LASVQHGTVVSEPDMDVRDVRVPAVLGLARRVDRAGWISIGLLALFCAFYVWTAASSIPIGFGTGADGIPGRLADALLHGRTDLGDAPPGLASLPNPYDPSQNGPYQGRVHDLSLYDGKLYAYWGPTPAIVLFGPARLLGVAFSQTLAVALFAFLGLVFSVLTLRTLLRRFVPETPAWKFHAGIVLLGLSNVVPYTIRRPMQYEVAIAAGLCFALLAAWLLLSAVLMRERPSLRRLALGSLALGLAVGARPSHAITTAGLLLLCAWLLRRTPKGAPRRRVAAALLAPVGVIGVMLALYNQVRFGSFTEFGLSYQLAAVDVTARDAFSLSYLLPGLWYYLIAPARLLLVFPFVELPPPPDYPGHVPAVYDGVEPTGGLLALAPLVLVLFAVPFLRGRHRLEADLRAVLLALVGIAMGLAVVASIAFWGATMRYEVDFASFLLIAALVVWYRLGAVVAAVRWRRLVTVLGAAAIAWASLLGLALSFSGNNSLLRVTHPGLWEALTRDFSWASRIGASVTNGGPTVATVDTPLRIPRRGGYAKLDDQDAVFIVDQRPVEVHVVMPSSGPVHLRAIALRGDSIAPGTPMALVMTLPDGRTRPVPLRGDDFEAIDVPLRLPRGVHRLILQASVQGQLTGYSTLILRNFRADDR